MRLQKLGFCVKLWYSNRAAKVPRDLDCDVELVAKSQTQHKIWQREQVNRREEEEGIALQGLPTTQAFKIHCSPLV